MKTWIVCMAAVGLLAMAAAAQASPPSYFPSYLLLRPSGVASHRAGRHHAYSAYGIPVQAPGYSYGYFGAPPHRQREIHRGFYGNYFEIAPR